MPPAGARFCAMCKHTHLPEDVNCSGYLTTAEGTAVKCRGSQSVSWAGYARDPDGSVEASFSRVAKVSKLRRMRLAKRLMEGTAAGDEADEYVRDYRHRRNKRGANLKREIAWADPCGWICPFCQNESQDYQDCRNGGDRTQCWHCSKKRPPFSWSKTRYHQRWLCPDCSYDVKTVAGLKKECPECGRARDWDNDEWRWA